MTGSAPNEGENADAERDDQYVRDLEQYRRRLDGAMLAGDLAWWEMDVETGAVDFHEHKADLLGMSPGDFKHYEDFTDRIHPDDYERAMQAMRDHIEGRAEKYDVAYRIRTATDDYRWFHDIGGVTEWSDDGRPAKVTGVVVDITDRKEIEHRLKRTNDQLSLLNRILRHDIRNDMTVILGGVDALSEIVRPDERDLLERIRNAGEHTVELTKDVRDLMQLVEGDSDEMELKPVALSNVLETEIERVTRSFDGVEIETRGGIPTVDVRANGMLSSVVGNLLNNAVQHNDKDVARIDVELEVRDDTVSVRIADNGPGIPAAQREDIFERDAKGFESEGTGLGLFLVATLVDAYGGTVSVADRDPTGTAFTVELPRASE